MAYTKTGPFTDYSGSPGISATFLNNIENAAVTAVNGDPWVSYTPTVTGFVIGSTGGITFVWRKESGLLHIRGYMGLGTGSSITGNVTFTFPVNVNTNYLPTLGVATFYGSSASAPGQVGIVDSQHATVNSFSVVGSNVLNAQLTATTPFTWVSGNYLEVDVLVTAA